jgi:long-chain acyl-CoA synthetase
MLIQKIHSFASQHPNKQAIVYKGGAINYAELLDIIDTRSKVLSYILEKNIILSHKNEIENLLNFLAAMAIGKVSIFASKHLGESQINILSNKHKAFIINETFSQEPKKDNNNLSQNTLKTTLNKHFLGVLTSGTTASPNLIWKDYQAWFSAFPHQSKVFDIHENDRLFVLDALSYSANLNAVLHMLWLGGTVVLTSLGSANTWHQQIENEAISTIFMVPSHYKLLVENGPELKKIRSVVSAGEKLSSNIAQKLIQKAPNALLTEYYGSAELGHITFHQNQDIVNNPLSVGNPFPEVKIRLEAEQIFVESPYISPEFRAIKTNFDLGYFIDGQLILMGRAGRMFNRRGLNVFAEEIENIAITSPFIIEAAAVGILLEDGSHEIFLAYTCTEGYQNNANNNLILNYLSNSLEATKRPSQMLEFENLPRTNFGKIDYNALARSFESEISF